MLSIKKGCYVKVICHYGTNGDYKYIAKVPIGNGKYRYFYDQAEYDAYLQNKRALDSSIHTIRSAVTSANVNTRAQDVAKSLAEKTTKRTAHVLSKVKLIDEEIWLKAYKLEHIKKGRPMSTFEKEGKEFIDFVKYEHFYMEPYLIED